MADLSHDDFEIDDEVIETDAPRSQSRPMLPNPPAMVSSGTERFEQRRFTGGDTLDEPILATIMRDVHGFARMLKQTLGWAPESGASKEWDLWGPLIFCLTVALVLSLSGPRGNMSIAFSTVFSVIWVGQAMVTMNIKLLGGSISFLHALSITGYCLFPLLLAALFGLVIHHRLIRAGFSVLMIAWSVWSASRGLKFSGVLPSRIFLASYPSALFYIVVGWMCVIA